MFRPKQKQNSVLIISRLQSQAQRWTYPVLNAAEKAAVSVKSSRWIEILGCGTVHPSVLRMCGIDPEEYTGFAFGVGLEKIALLKYEIDDMRLLYENDIRFPEAVLKHTKGYLSLRSLQSCIRELH